MSGQLPQPPEAALITRCRKAPPEMSMAKAADTAGISRTRWRQLENGYREFRGSRYPERAPAGTLAKMARAVGATPAQLRKAGRADAAGELQFMLDNGPFTEKQRIALAEEINRDAQET